MNKRDNDEGISLGIGATGKCPAQCDFCYSLPLRTHSLSFENIKTIIEGKDKKIKSINFGTGESIYNDRAKFEEIIDYCHDREIKLSVTTNGITIDLLSDERVRKFHDVDISLDFATQEKHDKGRGEDFWGYAHAAMEKCRNLGVEFSIAMALRNRNYKEIPAMLEKAAKENCNLRLNIFKPVAESGIYRDKLNYEQFWESMGLLFKHGELISCSEPIVNAMLGIKPIVPESPCGKNSLRIHPNGQVMPCVYWVNSMGPLTINADSEDQSKRKVIPADYWTKGEVFIKDLKESFAPAFEAESFRKIRTIPEYCTKKCDLVEICGGGCAARRYLDGRLYEPDEYCPIYLGRERPKIDVQLHEGEKDLIHSSYLCTLIFAGKK